MQRWEKKHHLVIAAVSDIDNRNIGEITEVPLPAVTACLVIIR